VTNNKRTLTLALLTHLILSGQSYIYSQDSDADVKLKTSVNLDIPSEDLDVINTADLEEIDDLDSLKTDIGEIIFEADEESKAIDKASAMKKDEKGKGDEVVIFDVGNEERNLLNLSKYVEGKVPNDEWNEIATAAKVDSYVIQKGDWLWKISQRLFGSGFYYSKVWSLNPHITNPHEVEPGMTLVFTTGDANQMPKVALGSFDSKSLAEAKAKAKEGDFVNYNKFGTNIKSKWMEERKKLMSDGVYFQYSTDETLDNLKKVVTEETNTEYKKYEPPVLDIAVTEPDDTYDDQGFDKNSRIIFDVKEGFYLNTFVTTNIVQDFGEIVGMPKENVFIQNHDKVFVEFNKSVNVKPGDKFSIYAPGGVVSHTASDRQGYKYTVSGQLRVLKAFKDNRWRCEVIELSGIVQRNDRLTVYTPKIGRIIKTFNKRNIEAAIVGSYEDSSGGMSLGNVGYLDRGRADGVEMGTVFELYAFTDRNTEKRLTSDPSYKIGEAVVISLTDNFATALLTNSSSEIPLGTLAITKTEEMAALARTNHYRMKSKSVSNLNAKAMNELDVELNLDELSSDLLEKASSVKLTEDEIEELDRLEREKSVIKDHEKDLRDIERLESELAGAEDAINESKLDEDKFLEQEDLNVVERNTTGSSDEFGSLDDLEDEFGLKYMDENLNNKENPYGLTEFDLEEIDELLNTEKL
jgi:hypothetical protein